MPNVWARNNSRSKSAQAGGGVGVLTASVIMVSLVSFDMDRAK